jgi:protein-S-isoprenylcysteine O-methyltransferase Ste14
MSTATVTITISAIWLSSEIMLSFLKRAKITDKRVSKSSFRFIWIVIALSVSAGVFSGYHSFGRYDGDSVLFPLIGVTLMVCGIVVRWIAIFTLRRQFNVDVVITRGHRLVKEGIYRRLRHPAYAGSLLSFLGLGLTFANYISILTIFVPIGLVFLYRIQVEEQALIDNFGDEYLTYRAASKRLIPFIY